MKFRYFNLKVAQEKLFTSKSRNANIDRRRFLKTSSLGVIALTPIVKIADKLGNSVGKPFTIKVTDNGFVVKRKDKTCWKFPSPQFENNAIVTFIQNNDNYKLSIENIKWRGSLHSFNLYTDIYFDIFGWRMRIEIPEFHIKESIDFIDWLDGSRLLESKSKVDLKFGQDNVSNSILVKGEPLFKMDNKWNISFEGADIVTLRYLEKEYNSSTAILCNKGITHQSFITAPSHSLRVILPKFDNMRDFLSDIKFLDNYSLSHKGEESDLNFLVWDDRKGMHHQSLWLNEKGNGTTFCQENNSYFSFKLNSLFFISETNGTKEPEIYLAAATSPNQWINNGIGSFKIKSKENIPDLQASGSGNTISDLRYSTQLTAFKPVVRNVVTMTTIMDKPKDILIAEYGYNESLFEENQIPIKIKTTSKKIQSTTAAPQDTIKRKRTINLKNTTILKGRSTININSNAEPKDTKKSKTNIVINKVDKNVVSEIGVGLFIPKELIFRIVRPEDMLILDFEFKNFVINKSSNNNVLALMDNKKSGLMIVRIQSQHTLEEAFFENNNIPDSSNTGNSAIKIPVKYIRANRSRLVFEYPSGGKPFGLNINELMDWSKFELRTNPRAWVTEEKKTGTILAPFLGSRRNITITNAIINKREPVVINSKTPVSYAVKLNQTNKKIADIAKSEDKTSLKEVLRNNTYNSLTINIPKQFPQLMAIGEIPEDNTSIEAPALMQMSPNQVAGFIHRIGLSALENSNRPSYELWHTKLGVRLKDGTVTDGLSELLTLRALWAYDANTDYKIKPRTEEPFMASLDANDRHTLMHTTSNHLIPSFSPIPIPVNKLMLTSLGAYLDWHAFFNVPKGIDTYLNISEWQHLATMGRDHYVKVVKLGHLFPFGHRAALVKVTQRKFKDIKERPAVNMQHMYIVVLQKEFIYGRTIPKGGFLEFPFQSVEISNSSTPSIDKPVKIDSSLSSDNFYIYSNNSPFLFDLIFTDKEGVQHKNQLPLAFLENEIARDVNKIKKIIINYQSNKLNNRSFDGQNIFYSESLIDGDTQYETRDMTFGSISFNPPSVGEISFRPIMQNAKIKLDAVNKFTGKSDNVTIKLVDDNNLGHVFASVENAVLDFTGGSDKSGGFLTPNMAITGLSRLHGVVGGKIEDSEKMMFNVMEVFKSVGNLTSAKIFGTIDIFSLFDSPASNFKGSMDELINKSKQIQSKITSLKDSIKIAEANALELEKTLLNDINKSQAQINNEINKIKNDLEKEKKKIKNNIKSETEKLRKLINDSIPRIPNLKTYTTDDAFHAEYKWIPDLGNKKRKEIIPGILYLDVNAPGKALKINTHLEKSIDISSPPKLTSEASFEKFSIELVDCLKINIKSLVFESGTGGKNGVRVSMENTPMQFVGALSFINNLNNFIPSNGFSDDGNGPFVEISSSGVRTGYSLTLPNIELGICMITNVSMGAYINLPFTGAPMSIGFNFCSRENPFLLTISCFGGGGFVKMITRLDGLETIEAAFEFGAALSLNLGVASGSVKVMGGIYLKIKKVQKQIGSGSQSKEISYNEVDLSAYLRMNGRLSVLGLIHVSLEFHLEMHARIVKGRVEKLEGSATLKVKVKIAFFSKTVSITVRRTLSGSGGDPNFAEMISEDDWQQYCIAFA